ncbi:MAG: hypothetical protein OJF49_003173 [Ktedonobacterales bacterium]|jgi:hypothetical protein|nr:MAG: hypothetical protein OJF49_003173 [Ktedonobacterales bacterium]
MANDALVEYEAIADELTATSPVVRGKTFGMPCLKENGKLFAGFTQGAMVFKLPQPHHAEALALRGAHLFDPSGEGHAMKEWVVVPATHAARWLDFARTAQRYVAAGRAK